MKKQILIVYHSFHHNNTEKLIRSFSDGIEIIPAKELGNTDLSKYDLVGFASGIYAGKFAPEFYEIIKQHAPELSRKASVETTCGLNRATQTAKVQSTEIKQVFLVYTSGSDNPKYGERMKTFLQGLGIKVVGVFSCRGYNTFGPFKLIGGKHKGHPDEQDIQNYQEFMEKLNQAVLRK